MKKFDFNSMGVHEMNPVEMKQTSGGIAPPWWLVAYGIYLYDNREKFIEGIKDGLKDIL